MFKPKIVEFGEIFEGIKDKKMYKTIVSLHVFIAIPVFPYESGTVRPWIFHQKSLLVTLV